MVEYDCWFQRRTPGSSGPAPDFLGRVYREEGGPVFDRAVEEFRRGLERLGFAVPLPVPVPRENSGPSAPPGIRIGTIPSLNKAYGLSLDEQKPDGFVIRLEGRSAVIAGQDERGTLYGVYRFLSLLARGKLKDGGGIAEAPAAPLRMINHWDNIDGSVERGYAGASLFFRGGRIDYSRPRVEDYARLLASVGINCLSINNVNVRGDARRLITEQFLPGVAALAEIFRPFGIRLLLSVNFSSPLSVGGLKTADPLDSAVAEWWGERAALVYRYIPDLAGFLVKADSEGESGPFQYGRSHADGANALAAALKPHGGLVVWRCFVYNSTQDWRDQTVDRARAAYDHFKPLDGAFADNVLLQIKHGPYDFQVREPVSPLFGALAKTRHLMELQITQEYTGQQIDLCYLPWIWADIMKFDTGRGGRVGELIGASPLEGLAAVANVGLDGNWTGHSLAQANLYGYGRLAWDPALGPEEIAAEWTSLCFGAGDTAETVKTLLLRSYPVYEKYNAPFGLCFMVNPGHHYGPSPEGYEFSRWGTYHRADRYAIGIDRTPGGTGFTGQYAPANAGLFADPLRCPENLILFFHRLRYDFRMKNGETLLQNIYNTRFEAFDELTAMVDLWLSLEGRVNGDCYRSVLSRLKRQLENAREWRDVINTYFWRKTGAGDAKGRKIHN
ncbi:MAG: alpha-glucuronidase [Treponema sp.]|jgi:alpha-glucuronidase|nr:alpha-glucuronidase [Treponema sp.]